MMGFNMKKQLNVGDAVYWIDPDPIPGSNPWSEGYSIAEIRTESGRIEDEFSLVILSTNQGSVSEVLACELA
jgi:hypothetical protein